jgi:hypothetical protein
VAHFTAGLLFSVAVKSQSLECSLEHKEYLPLCVCQGLVSPQYLKAEPIGL